MLSEGRCQQFKLLLAVRRKGLPGCLHLISGMTASHTGVASPVSFKMSYTFNSSNQLKMAVRKDYEGSNLVLEKTYRLYYVSM